MEFHGIKATGYCTMQMTIDYLNDAVDRMAYSSNKAVIEIALRQTLIESTKANNMQTMKNSIDPLVNIRKAQKKREFERMQDICKLAAQLQREDGITRAEAIKIAAQLIPHN